MIRSIIRGTGSYLPANVVTNDDIAKKVDTSDEWIRQRTGIKERRIAAENETTGDMAIKAAEAAIENAGLSGGDIDLVILATSTPDQSFPSTAVRVQSAIGMPFGPAFDIQAVCAGFVYALSVADKFITSGEHKRVLVIGAEKMSSILNWEDRTTCVLFGDGAGAIILEANESGQGNFSDQGIHSTILHANGNTREILGTTGGVSSTGDAGYITMQGREVFKYAVNYMSEIVDEILDVNALQASDIDWLIPHQANLRIIESTAKKLNIPMDKVAVSVDRHGNTSSASIPLALDELIRDKKIKRGDFILFEALGAGLTWGASLVRF